MLNKKEIPFFILILKTISLDAALKPGLHSKDGLQFHC